MDEVSDKESLIFRKLAFGYLCPKEAGAYLGINEKDQKAKGKIDVVE